MVPHLLLPCTDCQLWVSSLRTVCQSCKSALDLPCRWLDQQLAPSASCTDGTLTSDNTVDVLLQACEDGYIGIPCYSDLCPVDDVSSCKFMPSFSCLDDVDSSCLAPYTFVVRSWSLSRPQNTPCFLRIHDMQSTYTVQRHHSTLCLSVLHHVYKLNRIHSASSPMPLSSAGTHDAYCTSYAQHSSLA